MNSISHIQARALLDLAADLSLPLNERDSLDGHLSACDECRRYAGELAEVEGVLRQSLASNLETRKVQLSVGEILRQTRPYGAIQPALRFASRFAATPILILVLLAVTLALGLPRLTGGGTDPARTLTATALLVPTPSARITSTLLTRPECETILYQVQGGDSLEDIAQKFSISRDILMAYNNLTAESLPAQLDIPLCYATPLVGSQTPASTVTITPQAEYTLRTP
ncbi:MAG: LysM peptidoglycan-binding domain-containing protein [Chloroflexi bacterium]|nr:LysM peptidoglycan-binding domain-containing protein [Chloroflexota bacterium]